MPDFMSNSSYGEDAMLFGIMDRISLINRINLFEYSTYIDIGCFHPVIDNNTAFLYKIGWRGTLVDPNPAVVQEVEKYRKDDLFLEMAIAPEPGIKDFMVFSDTNSMNTLHKDFAKTLKNENNMEIVKTLSVNSITMDDLFSKHIEKFGQSPMIVNIDIEGMDYEVITSFSFKHRPLFIAIEDEILGSFEDSKLKRFMESKNYKVVCANFLTGIYMDQSSEFYNKIKKVGYYDIV